MAHEQPITPPFYLTRLQQYRQTTKDRGCAPKTLERETIQGQAPSVLVKLYVTEIGTDETRELLLRDSSDEVFISAVTRVEFVSAIVSRQASGSLIELDAKDIINKFNIEFPVDYIVVDVDNIVIQTAIDLALKYRLRD